ncbi:MAG: hypothetical protein U0572_16635 [Phycisphaerales bacterium]
MSSLFETLPPPEAQRPVAKMKVVHTPKHGSWVSMAECELSAMGRQAIGGGGCIANEQTLSECATTWESHRNRRFTPHRLAVQG